MRRPDEIRAQVSAKRAWTDRPFNLTFYCNAEPTVADDAVERWLDRLSGLYADSA